ncbi:DUF3541 domain-containing protein [Shewanella sp.]|uniref:DUF3541 domain-containing protein n=1 Tax=Shewanella sp. TaxID=50422 RepID=UPI004053942C
MKPLFSLVLGLSLVIPLSGHAKEPTTAVSQQEQIKTQPLDKAAIEASFIADAELIRNTYEPKLYSFPAYVIGHYGLRMYRQTLDPKYAMSVWMDMARLTTRLDKFAAEVSSPEQIQKYIDKRIGGYEAVYGKRGKRGKLRYKVTKKMPEYLFVALDLLSPLARANEYGLKHKNDAKFREILRSYDFKKYATDKNMIRAWAAQLANQVYWLRQMGEQDVVDDFIKKFRKTYPDNKDKKLSKKQYSNKIYGMTHIIFAASEYYKKPVAEKDFQWIYDYYRKNFDYIAEHSTKDVVAEVGINFLLAGLEDDPIVFKARQTIQAYINREHGMVPSPRGNTDLISGEHRNTLSIMLLDWRGVHDAPTYLNNPKVFKEMPYGLQPL